MVRRIYQSTGGWTKDTQLGLPRDYPGTTQDYRVWLRDGCSNDIPSISDRKKVFRGSLDTLEPPNIGQDTEWIARPVTKLKAFWRRKLEISKIFNFDNIRRGAVPVSLSLLVLIDYGKESVAGTSNTILQPSGVGRKGAVDRVGALKDFQNIKILSHPPLTGIRESPA